MINKNSASATEEEYSEKCDSKIKVNRKKSIVQSLSNFPTANIAHKIYSILARESYIILLMIMMVLYCYSIILYIETIPSPTQVTLGVEYNLPQLVNIYFINSGLLSLDAFRPSEILLYSIPLSRRLCRGFRSCRLVNTVSNVGLFKILIILQYIYSLQLTEDELPSENPNVLRQIGLEKPKEWPAVVTLFAKVIYTLIESTVEKLTSINFR